MHYNITYFSKICLITEDTWRWIKNIMNCNIHMYMLYIMFSIKNSLSVLKIAKLVSDNVRNNFFPSIFAILQFVGIFDYAPKKYSEITYKMIKIDQYDQYDPEFVSSFFYRRKTSNFLILKVGIKPMHLKHKNLWKGRIIVSIFFVRSLFFLNCGLSFN